MFRASLLLLTLAALLSSTPATFAAKGKGDRKAKRAAAVAARGYDTNSNGKIEGDEAAAVQKAYEGDKNGALKPFDRNLDGKLDDSEIAHMHLGEKGKGKGKKKKNQ